MTASKTKSDEHMCAILAVKISKVTFDLAMAESHMMEAN